MKATITQGAVLCGTAMAVVQEGISAEPCLPGWQESLLPLGRLADAEIP